MRCTSLGENHLPISGVYLCDKHLEKLTNEEAARELGGEEESLLNEEIKEAAENAMRGADSAIAPGDVSSPIPFSRQNETSIKNELAPVTEEATDLIAMLENLEITDGESADLVAGLLQEYHEKIKNIEAIRKEATAPMLQAKKTVDSWFKPTVKVLEEAKALLKLKMDAWMRTQNQARQEALDSGDPENVLAVPDPEVPEGLSTRTKWIFRIADFDLVPRKFLTVDTQLVEDEMNRLGPENTKIPGIEIKQETYTVMGRGKK